MSKLLWEAEQVLPCFYWLDGHEQLLLDRKMCISALDPCI